nr:M48 family metallopeptidase [Roseospira navarrensis]
MWPARAAPDPKPDAVVVGDRAVPLVVRVNPRARRVALKVDAAAGRVVLVIPHKRDEKAARRFLHSRTDWLHAALERLPPAIALTDGASVPLGGVPHTVRHCPDARRGVWLEDGEIRVSGQAEHLPRRLRDWLKGQARAAITARVAVHAEALGVTPGRITVKDTRSRWGSCAASGALSFSWRLVMAPDWVLDYVTAHEVAHLRELNHSPAFWRHVETLAPGLRGPARDWLRDHGAALHRVG